MAVVLSRVAVIATGAITTWLVVFRHQPGAFRAHLVNNLFVNSWGQWDARWLVYISRHGYREAASQAFFPLYPLIVHNVDLAFLSTWWVSTCLSLLFYVAAMALLYRLIAEEFDKRVAALTVALISVFPTAFVFSIPYTESLFVLLSVACFFFARRRRWLLAGLAGMLATLTRSTGLLLLVPLVVLLAQDKGWSWRRPSLDWVRGREVPALALIPLAVVLYMSFLWYRFGNPFLFSTSERTHWGRSFDWPWVDVWRGLKEFVSTVADMARHYTAVPGGLRPGGIYMRAIGIGIAPFLSLLLAAVVLPWAWRRLPSQYRLYAVAAAVFPLLFPTAKYPLYSYHRLILVDFPLFVAAALLLRGRPYLFWPVIVLSAFLMVMLAAAFAAGVHSA